MAGQEGRRLGRRTAAFALAASHQPWFVQIDHRHSDNMAEVFALEGQRYRLVNSKGLVLPDIASLSRVGQLCNVLS